MPPPNTRELIEARVHVDSATGCWEYPRRPGTNGYKQITIAGVTRTLHRLMYEWHVGPIEEGLVIDHLCRNRGCCNPGHLEAVTFAENVARGVHDKPQRTRCAKGHELTDNNRYMRTRAGGKRDGSQCLQCKRDAAKASYHRLRRARDD